MNREERLHTIFTQFDNSAKEFCERTRGLACDISAEYSGEELPQNLKYRLAKIFYNSLAVEFIYTAHGTLDTINSILGCVVYPNKQDETLGIPLPMMADYCDRDVTQPLYIPLISNATGMKQAFSCIGNVLEDLLPEIMRRCSDPSGFEQVEDAFLREMNMLFDIHDTDNRLDVMEEPWRMFCALRFCSQAFLNALKGEYALAAKQLRKTKKLTGYEKRMIRLWSSGKLLPVSGLSAIVKNAESYSVHGTQKVDFKEFAALFISWLVLTPLASAVYLGVFFLTYAIEGHDAVYLMGPSYNYPFCFVAGFITAIEFSYFTRGIFYKILFRKRYEQYREMDHIQNGGCADRLMRAVLALFMVLGVSFCVLLVRWNLKFTDTGLIDNSQFFSLKGQYYSYEEIDYAYYKPDRVNGFNETIAYPSYVLVLKSGREIDLYEFDEIERYETVLTDLLEEKRVELRSAP